MVGYRVLSVVLVIYLILLTSEQRKSSAWGGGSESVTNYPVTNYPEPGARWLFHSEAMIWHKGQLPKRLRQGISLGFVDVEI